MSGESGGDQPGGPQGGSSDDEWSAWLERVWAAREDVVYPTLFGGTGEGIYVLTEAIFTDVFGQTSVDPRWLHEGVFEYAPSSLHAGWLYVSSGLSNPWDQELDHGSEISGLGCELLFEVADRGEWAAVRLLHLLAFQLLLAAGRYPGKDVLRPGDRIPLRDSIVHDSGSVIRWLFIWPRADLPRTFQLESGNVELLSVVGITDEEAQFARDFGAPALIAHLSTHGAFPITDIHRPCTVRREAH